MAGMERPSTQRMLTGAAIAALGCGVIASAMQLRGSISVVQILWLWTIGGTVIGAGLLTPFRLAFLGAVLGLALIGGLALFVYVNFPIC
jgi:hypothetical protein